MELAQGWLNTHLYANRLLSTEFTQPPGPDRVVSVHGTHVAYRGAAGPLSWGSWHWQCHWNNLCAEWYSFWWDLKYTGKTKFQSALRVPRGTYRAGTGQRRRGTEVRFWKLPGGRGWETRWLFPDSWDRQQLSVLVFAR